MSDENQEFETAEAGASLTYPSEAGALRKGGHVLIKGKPCKISEISISKTGKHGHAKAAITGIDIFTNKKYEDNCPTSHNMDVPNVQKTEYTLIDLDLDAGTMSVLLENGETKDDLNLPASIYSHLTEVREGIAQMFNDGHTVLVTVLSAMDQEQVIGFKKAAD